MVGEPHGGRHRDEQRVDAVLGLTLAIGLMDGDGGDGCGRLSLDVAGEQAEIVLAPALQRVEGAPVLLGDVCGHGGGLPRRWLGGPPLGPLDRPAGAGPHRSMATPRWMPSAAPDALLTPGSGGTSGDGIEKGSVSC